MDKLNFNIKWMLQKDVNKISSLESRYQNRPMSADNISKKLNDNSIGFVVESNLNTIGYMIYEYHNRYYTINRIFVLNRFSRIGIGTRLINNLKSIMTDKINQIRTYVDIDDIELHMFYSSNSFHHLKLNKISNKEFSIFVFNRQNGKNFQEIW
jgi:hypothetical protein